jgi:hypothetical protein
VLRAVLFDPEARQQDGSSAPQPLDGKLREPVLIITGLLRSLGARSNGAGLSIYARSMNQNLFYPATVFNYYPPTYQLPDPRPMGRNSTCAPARPCLRKRASSTTLPMARSRPALPRIWTL